MERARDDPDPRLAPIDTSRSAVTTLPSRLLGPIRLALLLLVAIPSLAFPADPPALPQLGFGADQEGGAPYFFQDPATGRRVGFEADLMAALGRKLGVEPVLQQVQWEYLLEVLARGESGVDVVLNGYELTAARARDYLPTRPYYVYQLQLLARNGGQVRSWADFDLPRPGGGPWTVGVMGMSAGDKFARRFADPNLEVRTYDGATNAMMSVLNGQIDATLQDLPAALHYAGKDDFRDLAPVGPPDGCGYYVMYVRKGNEALRDRIDSALGELIASGELRRILEKYGLWNDAQGALASPGPVAERSRSLASRSFHFDFGLLDRFGRDLLIAAGTTIILAFTAMPLAMVLGLLIALGRVYGPRSLSTILAVYVELIRGTPLLIQLYVLFFLLPRLGLTLSPWVAGVSGLAINYSAYEAEIYRAGLQAIPRGQMEAALALGMSRWLAIRRVIVPQAMRIVIPPVTSDFIALFKDTSVCSVITLVELTKQYAILFNSQGGVVEFGVATAALYMAMSLPLSWLSRWVERRLDAVGTASGKGVIA
jgi:polar amino acid transport system substrate-binding protein